MKQILAFILLSGMLCWLMFTPIYHYVLVTRKAVLQNEVDYLLEIGANADHGYIDAQMIAASKQRLRQLGFDPAQLEYEIYTLSGVSGEDALDPVPRGDGIDLTIRYPYGDLFQIDRLIGLAPPASGTLMGATGLRMSEYVP